MSTSYAVVPFNSTPKFRTVTFSDGSKLSSAKLFDDNIQLRKKLKVADEGRFNKDLHVLGDLYVSGKTYVNNSEIDNSYVDQQTGWGDVRWTFENGVSYNINTDSLIAKIFSLEETYVSQTELEEAFAGYSLADTSRYLLAFGPNTFVSYVPDGSGVYTYYNFPVTTLAANSSFMIRNNIFKFQNSSIGVGKVLTCIDSDGTVQWQDPNTTTTQITYINTTEGMTNDPTFYVTDTGSSNNLSARGFYFFPSLSDGVNGAITNYAQSIVMALGYGSIPAIGSTTVPHVICPYSRGCESITFTPATNQYGTNGKIRISAGTTSSDEQYIDIVNNGIIMKLSGMTSFTPGYILSIKDNSGVVEWRAPTTYIAPSDISINSIQANIATFSDLTVSNSFEIQNNAKASTDDIVIDNTLLVYNSFSNFSYWFSDPSYYYTVDYVYPARWGTGNGETQTPYYCKCFMSNNADKIYKEGHTNFLLAKRTVFNLEHSFCYRPNQSAEFNETVELFYQIEKMYVDISINGSLYKQILLPTMKNTELKSPGCVTAIHSRSLSINGQNYTYHSTDSIIKAEFMFCWTPQFIFELPDDIPHSATISFTWQIWFQFKYRGEWIQHINTTEGYIEPFLLKVNPNPVNITELTETINGIHYVNSPGLRMSMIPSTRSGEFDSAIPYETYWLQYLHLMTNIHWSFPLVKNLKDYFPDVKYYSPNDNYYQAFPNGVLQSYVKVFDSSLDLYSQSNYPKQIFTVERLRCKNNVELNGHIFAPNGMYYGCGIAGRAGYPSETYTNISSPSNSQGSYNNWGSIHNFFWTPDGKLQFWVDYTKVHEVSPNYCDYRIKYKIESLAHCSDRLLQVPIFSCSHKDVGCIKGSDNHIGFFAHEIQDAYPDLPHLISGHKDELDDDGNEKVQSINTHELLILALKCIQELKQEILELKQNIYHLN